MNCPGKRAADLEFVLELRRLHPRGTSRGSPRTYRLRNLPPIRRVAGDGSHAWRTDSRVDDQHTVIASFEAPRSGGTSTPRVRTLGEIARGDTPWHRSSVSEPRRQEVVYLDLVRSMAQFFAYVYREKGGYRVFVEGIADVHASSLADAERQARGVIERAVFASHPEREPQPAPNATALLELELRLVRVGSRQGRRAEKPVASSGSKRPSTGTPFPHLP